MQKKNFYLYVDGKSVKVSEEVYREYYRGERKEKYFMEDLKKEREHSYECLIEQNITFVAKEDLLEDEIVRSVLLKHALQNLSLEEQELIQELYYLDKTERQVSATLHMTRTTLRRKRDKALAKLKTFIKKD